MTWASPVSMSDALGTLEGMEATEMPTPRDDRAELSAIVDSVVARRREIAALHAEEARLLHAARQYALGQMASGAADDGRPDDIPMRSVAAEIAAATRQSDRTVQARMSEAAVWVEGFPATLAALGEGRISRAHAAVIADAGARIDEADARAAFEDAALAVAERETAGRLRPVARRLAQQFHPVTLDERHRTAAQQRRVWVADRDDGLAEFGMTGPAHLIHGVFDRVTQLARAVVDARQTPAACAGEREGVDAPAPDTRHLDEVRADVALAVLLTGHADAHASAVSAPGAEAIRARVQVTIPVSVLVGTMGGAGELAGYGPIDAGTARALAGGASGWDRLFQHPDTGAIVAVDRYRPSLEQKRLLAARDEHCRFPGCRQPAPRCDIDHTIAAAHDGPTTISNLAHLCRRHHTMKHHSAWRVKQRPDGTLEWTAPTGRVYDDRPARTLVFEPAPF